MVAEDRGLWVTRAESSVDLTYSQQVQPDQTGVSQRMINAGLAVLRDARWTNAASSEWLDALWRPGHRPENLIEQIYLAMRGAAD